jgi:hypothetical protein
MNGKIDFGTQLGLVRSCKGQAIKQLSDLLVDPAYQRKLLQEVDDRLAMGYEIYGDEAWHKTEEELAQDLIEELADSVHYLCIALANKEGF